MSKVMEALKQKAKAMKRDLTALYLAYKHPEVPWHAKLFTAIVIGYAISPIDLVPDFIPVLGYLDDLILIPAGIALALKMIPEKVMLECREKAAEMDRKSLGSSWIAAAVILAIWIILLWAIIKGLLIKVLK